MPNERFIYINPTILTSLTMEIELTKMTSKGQVVIPQDIREEAGLKEGEKFFVYSKDDSIILKRARKVRTAEDMEQFDQMVKEFQAMAKEKGITKKDVEEAIRAVRAEKS